MSYDAYKNVSTIMNKCRLDELRIAILVYFGVFEIAAINCSMLNSRGQPTIFTLRKKVGVRLHDIARLILGVRTRAI